ncbi:MAG: BLUF domain-containing protein [Phycisphaerales bacterium]
MNAATNQLRHIVYVSRRAAGLTDYQVVDGIVLPAMTRNRRLDLSGCIWFDHGYFFQVIEGPAAELAIVFESIERDKRHHALQVLSAQNIERRDFERFSMRLIADETPMAIRQIIAQYEEDSTAPSPPPARPEMLVRRLISEISAAFV